MLQTSDSCLDTWMDREALAETKIPVISRLYRDSVRHYVGMSESTLAHNVTRGLVMNSAFITTAKATQEDVFDD